MKNIVLFGPPGSGKGTQAGNLVKKFDFVHLSTGEMFRFNMREETELGVLAKEYIAKGELVPDEVTTKMLRAEVINNKTAKGLLFDGYPRTTEQAKDLDEILKQELNEEIDLCLALVVEDEILVQRLLKRGETSNRDDDQNEGIIRNRIAEYYKKTNEVSQHYTSQNKWVEINGEGKIDEITQSLIAEIEKL